MSKEILLDGIAKMIYYTVVGRSKSEMRGGKNHGI
jgi:hypothetical protein